MTHFVYFGLGALGSQIVMHLASPENTFTLIDDDRVSENNVLTRTSAFQYCHIDAMKSTCLAEMLWQKGRSKATPYNETVTEKNVMSFIKTVDGNYPIVVDAFDNMESRSLLTNLPTVTLHVGVSLQRTGSILWDNNFQVPDEIGLRSENEICTNMLGAPILRLTSAIAVSVLEEYIETGQQRNFWVTESLQVKELLL